MYKILAVALLFTFIELRAQEREVLGRIVDETGKPIPGVNVLIKGTPNGTATHSDGSFKISLPDGKAILVFSFIGYKTFEHTVYINKDFKWQIEATLAKKGSRSKGSGKFVDSLE